MTNDVLADINRQTRDRLAKKADRHIDDLVAFIADDPAARHIIGSLRATVELLGDVNSDDIEFELTAFANLFTLRATEYGLTEEYSQATEAIECAEAFTVGSSRSTSRHFASPASIGGRSDEDRSPLDCRCPLGRHRCGPGRAHRPRHRIVVDPHRRRRDVAVSSATLWGEVVDR
ncbi:hypothetical protein GS928_24885 [Rhodococcus hoagii]|nr:hypothetical protein [Prescottella equi]